MQSTFLISLALFSALSLGAEPVIDPKVESDVLSRLESFGSSILNDPTVASEIGATPSEIAKIKANLPKIESDLKAYADSVIHSPQFTSVVDILATIVPASVQSQIESNPGGFIISLVTESSYPAYVSAIPTAARDYMVSVADHVVSDVEDDINGPQPTGPPGPYSYSTSPTSASGAIPYLSSGYPRATGTGFATGAYSPSGHTGGKLVPTSAPAPFTGAAPSFRGTAAVGVVAAVLAGVAALVVL